MKKHILALLGEKFRGERKDGLQVLAGMLAMQAKTEEDASALVDGLSPDEVKAFIKEYRSDVDRETSEAIKKAMSKKPKADEPEPQEVGEPNEGTEPQPRGKKSLADMIADAVKQAVEPLQAEIQATKVEKQTQQRLQLVEEALKDCRDEHFAAQTRKSYQRMTFADEESFTAYLDELKTDANAASQRIADMGLSGFGRTPLGGNTNVKPSAEEVDKILGHIG